MNSRYLAPIVLVLAAAGGGYYLLQKPLTEPPTPTAPVAAPAAASSAPSPALPVTGSLPLPVPELTAAKAEGYIAYPDGTFYPPLNGVKVAPKIVFHPRLSPFTKVVGQWRDARGRVWYVHENGVRSTTFINGAGVASYEVEKDTTPQLQIPEEIPGGTGK